MNKQKSTISGLKRPDLFRQEAFVDGQWCAAENAQVIEVNDPATLEIIATVPDMGAVEAERAVAAAHKALPGWSALPAKARARLLRRWFDLIEANAADIALILTREQGKPYAEALGEIAYAAGFIEWFAEEAKRIDGDTLPAPRADQRLLVIKQPVGVVAAITPWNFPAAMITRKAGAGLAAGCTVVLKPSDLTPLTALALAVLAEEAGLPEGVFNVITGRPEGIGGVLTGDPRIRKLTFTGSTRVGKLLTAACAGTMKRVSMELGGNAALIVFNDADIDLAIEGAMASKFRNTGQTCVCANRILVQSGIYDQFVAALKIKVEALKVATGLQPDATQGPLINASAIEKVERHVADALKKGAILITGGHRISHVGAGAFYAPTILTEASPDMELAQEETFGPVAPIFRFQTAEEAVAIANSVTTGLAAYVFTRDLSQSLAVSEALQTGMIGLNTGAISTEMAPFGGVKESGLGREGSKYGIEEYLDLKFILIGGVGGI